MLVVSADRQFDEGGREVVSCVAPVESWVSHQDHEPTERERQEADGQDPMRDPDPAGVRSRDRCRRDFNEHFSHGVDLPAAFSADQDGRSLLPRLGSINDFGSVSV